MYPKNLLLVNYDEGDEQAHSWEHVGNRMSACSTSHLRELGPALSKVFALDTGRQD